MEKEILDKLKELLNGQKHIEAEIKRLDKRISKEHELSRKELKQEINYVYEMTREIQKDIKFIKHKEFQNEQELFELKDQVKIVR
ncbi:hypothetical protein [Wukongibacter sp. M2B1]|uniref:hypothetical protein n=1 Tax=Wukongibacter sp. M2B1 TaxID=3088895 RepID=UPI003D7B68D3